MLDLEIAVWREIYSDSKNVVWKNKPLLLCLTIKLDL